MRELEIKEAISVLAEKELARSYEKFPAFNSPHEGYAVIKKEVEECEEELGCINDDLQEAWHCIRENSPAVMSIIKKNAEDLAYEAIQVAAMAQKYIDSLGGVTDA